MNDELLFHQACERPAHERAAFLDQACAGDPAQRRRVEALVQAHANPGSFLQAPAVELPATTDSDPQLAAYVAGRPAPNETSGRVIGHYQLLQQLGEGGFGIVFLAEQQQPVRRQVALKLIKAGMDSRQVIARFEAERQALALMDHPNIARVFDADETSDGRPYFVMELVNGVPITQFCDEHRLPPRARLELFASVCQAIQHAHHKGIIHRDLKPSNVLVTLRDGKPVVKVIDFGIAKATGPQLTDQTLFTKIDQVVGTPLYMSPEQAGLSGLDIDTRSDIYSLGVLLYELLTGTTPFDRARLKQAAFDEIRRIIREEEPPRPSTRLSGSATLPTVAAQRQTDPKWLRQMFRGEVDWIVMKALEKDRNRRYATANGFAADVLRYLADEPVQACPPSAWYRFRKFARRNKGKLAVAACLFLVFAVLAGSVGWILQERAGRAAGTAFEVEVVLQDVARLQQDKKWAEALAALNRGEGLFAGGQGSADLEARLRDVRASVEQRLRQARADQHMSAELVEIRLKQAEVTEGHFDMVRADADYAAAFRNYGIDVEKLTIAAAAAAIADREIAAELVAALDNWADARRHRKLNDPAWKHLLAVARIADADPLRNRVREAVAQGDRQVLVKLAGDKNVTALPPATLVLLGRSLLGSGAVEEALALHQQAQGAYPGDFWTNHDLAHLLTVNVKPRQDLKAIGYFRAALALRQSPGVYLNLGHSLARIGALDEAIVAYRKAIGLKGDYVQAHFSVGRTRQDQGRVDEAIAAYRQAIALKPDYGAAHDNLGIMLQEKGWLDEAIASHQRAIDCQPTNPSFNLAITHLNLGHALSKQGRLEEANAAYRRSIRCKSDFSEAHSALGRTLSKQGRPEEASAAYQKAIALKPDSAEAQYAHGSALHELGRLDEAMAAYQQAIQLKPDHAQAHCNLGIVLRKKGRLDEAIAAYRRAIALKPDLEEPHHNLGVALSLQGRLDEAVAAYRQAIQLKPDLAGTHFSLGNALHKLGRLDEAVGAFQQSIHLDPQYAEAHTNLGLVLGDKGDRSGAIAAYQKAIALKPGNVEAHKNLGSALRARGELSGAIAAFQKAIALKLNNAAAHHNLGLTLRDKRDLSGAIAAYQKAIELRPVYPEAHDNLGVALRDKGDLSGAMAAFQKAIALQPDYAAAHHNLGVALRDKGDLAGAIAAVQKAIALQPGHALAHHNLGNILRDKGDLSGAIAAYQKAIVLKPDFIEAHNSLGAALRDQGDLSGARAAFQKAIALKPDSAEAHINRGNARYHKGDLSGAIAAYQKAIAVKPDYAMAHNNLGNALREKGDRSGASAACRKAIALKPDYADAHYNLGLALRDQGDLPGASAAFHKVIALKPDHAEAHSCLGNALRDLGDGSGASAAYRQGIALHEQRIKKSPTDTGPQSDLGETCNNLAMVLMAQDQLAEARQLLERALGHQQTALKANPKNPTYRQYLRNHTWHLAETLVRLGEHGEAARAAAELPRIYPDGWHEYHRAAAFLARCVPLAKKGAPVSEAKRALLARSYSDQAVALLRQAITRGYQDAGALTKDPAFAPLRSQEAFQQLLRELKAGTKGGKAEQSARP